MDYFIGKATKKGTAKLKLFNPGQVILEAEPSATTARVVYSNNDEVGVGEVWEITEGEASEPAPKFNGRRIG